MLASKSMKSKITAPVSKYNVQKYNEIGSLIQKSHKKNAVLKGIY